jgi:hypothetical protein
MGVLPRSSALLVLLFLLPSVSSAQTVPEGYIAGGVTNLELTTVSGGVDVVRPRGLVIGASGTLAFQRASELFTMTTVSGRLGFQAIGTTRTRWFTLAELGTTFESDCCGTSLSAGVALGATHWLSRRSGLRFEGKVLFPLAGDGGMLVFQAGWGFR